MMDTYSDGLGGIDFERSQHGSGMSKKAQAKKFISVLNRKAAESYRRYLAKPPNCGQTLSRRPIFHGTTHTHRPRRVNWG